MPNPFMMFKMTKPHSVALCFPPHWYYTAVPADLVYTGAFLQTQGVAVKALDLSAGLLHHHLRNVVGYQALMRRETYLSAATYAQAGAQVEQALVDVSQRYRCEYRFSALQFPDVDETHVPSALRIGLSLSRNPALPVLSRAVSELMSDEPLLVAVALVHPDQWVPTLAFGRLLRAAGYQGFLCVYGAHEDVLSPEDLLDDLAPTPGQPLHLFFADFDGAIIGEAETALYQLFLALTQRQALTGVPSLLAPKHGVPTVAGRGREKLRSLSRPDYSLVTPSIYPFPAPLPDMRLSRGCPWNRCAFCAITTHQQGYRALPASEVVPDLVNAHTQLGASFFRFRDDLLTPKQLLALSLAVSRLSFPIRFSVRCRFEKDLTAAVLQTAKAAGLEELWLGLESAVPRVRDRMRKGVEQAVIERILREADQAHIRVRALCLLGFPGETAAERRATLDFLVDNQHRLASCSLTPFLLMRRSPVGQDPAAFGVTVVPDPRPAHERVCLTQKAQYEDAPTREEIEALTTEAIERLGARFLHTCAGPTLEHAMMYHSVQQNGWPGPSTA